MSGRRADASLRSLSGRGQVPRCARCRAGGRCLAALAVGQSGYLKMRPTPNVTRHTPSKPKLVPSSTGPTSVSATSPRPSCEFRSAFSWVSKTEPFCNQPPANRGPPMKSGRRAICRKRAQRQHGVVIATGFADGKGVEQVRVARRELPGRERRVAERRPRREHGKHAIPPAQRVEPRRGGFRLRQVVVRPLRAGGFRTGEGLRQRGRPRACRARESPGCPAGPGSIASETGLRRPTIPAATDRRHEPRPRRARTRIRRSSSLSRDRLIPNSAVDGLALFAVLRDDGVFVNEVERPARRRRANPGEERRPAERLVQRRADRRIGAEPAVDPQLRSRSEDVERQVARGELHAETLRRRVLDIEPQHQERRRVRLRLRADDQRRCPAPSSPSAT